MARARARAAGTAADRVAAAAVAVADAPAASLGALDDLLKTATKRGGGRNSAIAALDALNDLFSGGALLPPTRRLVSLAARPLDALTTLPPTTRSKLLLYWGLEDALCRRAGEHAEALARATRDSVDALKRVGVRGLASRLVAAPEGEADALTALVNKLGDPDRRLAASAARALSGVLDTHPAMAPTLARYVERAAFRPGQAPRARHAAVLFLAGLPLPRGAGAGPLAEQLADCYFGLFRAIVDGTLGAAADARAAAVAGAEAAGAKAAGRAAAKARKGRKKGGGKLEAAAPAVVQVSLGRGGGPHHHHTHTLPRHFLRCGAATDLLTPSAIEQPMGGQSHTGCWPGATNRRAAFLSQPHSRAAPVRADRNAHTHILIFSPHTHRLKAWTRASWPPC